MDFTVLPNEREIADLRNLLTGIDAEIEMRSERQSAPIARAGSRRVSRAGHAVGGGSSISQRAARWHLSDHLEPQNGMEG